MSTLSGSTLFTVKSSQRSTFLSISLLVSRPIQRTISEVEVLAYQLSHFSYLFPPVVEGVAKKDFFLGLAKRAIVENLPARGYARMCHIKFFFGWP